MELLAFSLAILSGVGHAVWNFLTKRAIDKQIFLWWMLFLRTVFLVPLFAIWAQGISVSLVSLVCATGSAVFYATFMALMGKALRKRRSLFGLSSITLGPGLCPYLGGPFPGGEVIPVGVDRDRGHLPGCLHGGA